MTSKGPIGMALAERIGALFVMALQSDDPDIRDAAQIDKAEVSFHGGSPSFVPVARLVKALEMAHEVMTCDQLTEIAFGIGHDIPLALSIEATRREIVAALAASNPEKAG